MNDDPLMKPAQDESPDYPYDPATPGAVIGGVLLGVVGGILLSFLATFVMSNVLPDGGVGAAAAMFGLPVLVGIVLLAVPRLRRIGAGFVMGLGIGSIVSAGVCGAFMAWLSASLGG